jgi:hypothetical protein
VSTGRTILIVISRFICNSVSTGPGAAVCRLRYAAAVDAATGGARLAAHGDADVAIAVAVAVVAGVSIAAAVAVIIVNAVVVVAAGVGESVVVSKTH